MAKLGHCLQFLTLLSFPALEFLDILGRQVSLYLPNLFREIQVFLVFFCRDKQVSLYLHILQCIFLPALRTRRCDVIAISCVRFRLHLTNLLERVLLSIPGLFDATGLFTDEELVETVKDRFIVAGFDFATILFSPSCSCILFAIVSVQLVKLKF